MVRIALLDRTADVSGLNGLIKHVVALFLGYDLHLGILQSKISSARGLFWLMGNWVSFRLDPVVTITRDDAHIVLVK